MLCCMAMGCILSSCGRLATAFLNQDPAGRDQPANVLCACITCHYDNGTVLYTTLILPKWELQKITWAKDSQA